MVAFEKKNLTDLKTCVMAFVIVGTHIWYNRPDAAYKKKTKMRASFCISSTKYGDGNSLLAFS